MNAHLPDIAGLAHVAPAIWQQLAARLRAAGFLKYVATTWHGERTYDALKRPVQVWRAQRERIPAAFAYQLFVLRAPIAVSDAVELLGRNVVEALVEGGLLVRPDKSIVEAVLSCRMFMQFLVLCDDLAFQGDAVFGVGPGNSAFRAFSERRARAGTALDLGCGAGATALWLSTRARHVVATDINPRALALLRINTALNGVANIEARHGDLFEPVAGQAFDLVAAQPPFVPYAPTARPATYRFGGPAGNEVVLRILSELPRHLTAHGRALIVFEHAITDAGGVGSNEPQAPPDTRALTIVGAPVDADTYSVRHAALELRIGIEEFDRVATEMRQHLENLGIRAVCPALHVVERALQSRGWHEIVHAGSTLWNEVDAVTIDRLFAGRILLHEAAKRAARTVVRIPEGSLIIRSLDREGVGDAPVYLGLPPGNLFSSVEFRAHEWATLDSLQQGADVTIEADLYAKAIRAGLIDA